MSKVFVLRTHALLSSRRSTLKFGDDNEIVIDEENQKYSVSNGVMYDKSKSTLIRYPEGKTGEECIIPDGVKYSHNYIFARLQI